MRSGCLRGGDLFTWIPAYLALPLSKGRTELQPVGLHQLSDGVESVRDVAGIHFVRLCGGYVRAEAKYCGLLDPGGGFSAFLCGGAEPNLDFGDGFDYGVFWNRLFYRIGDDRQRGVSYPDTRDGARNLIQRGARVECVRAVYDWSVGRALRSFVQLLCLRRGVLFGGDNGAVDTGDARQRVSVRDSGVSVFFLALSFTAVTWAGAKRGRTFLAVG